MESAICSLFTHLHETCPFKVKSEAFKPRFEMSDQMLACYSQRLGLLKGKELEEKESIVTLNRWMIIPESM